MKKKIFATIPILFVLVTVLLLSPMNPSMNIAFATGSTPDSYGNRICSLVAEQYNGTNWNAFPTGYSYNGAVENFGLGVSTAAIYSSGQTWWRVKDAGSAVGSGCTNPIVFDVVVYLNSTLATDSSGASANVRINMTITGGAYTLSNVQFGSQSGYTQVGAVQNATYYKVTSLYIWNVTSYPAAGVTYNVQIQYSAYY